ncbi:hypothetical protein [Cardinium endosymbiont of Culicoides punctatus]|uniref:hypothetical protein n=1 Tax=Cardinium endosymbiont of Culicoides punctatus TaxID=2304601 RepID=UPI0010D6DB63|nr:hypothetical protein [Cardinium endosymbiont of Culicoides punctatus]TDG95798.1 hypothetical protein CCPUN_00840 [Cardinium endosymbiont of Culicoides punctatus]
MVLPKESTIQHILGTSVGSFNKTALSTQQMRTYNLPMKGTIYFDYIMNGKKSLKVG